MNRKDGTALVACLGFISGFCFLIYEIDQPTLELRSPLISQAGMALGSGVTASEGLIPDVRGRFAYESPTVQEAAAQLLAERPADVAPAVVQADAVRRAGLPPLVAREDPAIVQLVAAADEGGWGSAADATMPPLDDAVFLAFDDGGEWADVAHAGDGGEDLRLAAARGDANLDPAAPLDEGADATQVYRVAPGDSLVKIARKVWQDDSRQAIELLIAANPKLRSRPNRILVGEEITIPDLAAVQAAAEVARADDGGGALPPVRPALAYEWYTVRKSDSLMEIARRQLKDASRWREIAELNRIPRPDRILAGRRIKVPVLASLARR